MGSDDEHLGYGLAFETSGDPGEVTLGRAGDVLDRVALREPRAHARTFVAAVAEICGRHNVRPIDIGALFVSLGPGSFTGLRIGVTVTKMLSFATARSSGKEAAVVGVRLQVTPRTTTIADPPEVGVLRTMRGRVLPRHSDATLQRNHVASPFWPLPRMNRDATSRTCCPGISSIDERGRSNRLHFWRRWIDAAVMGDGVRRYATARASGLRVLSRLFIPTADVVIAWDKRCCARRDDDDANAGALTFECPMPRRNGRPARSRAMKTGDTGWDSTLPRHSCLPSCS